MASNRKAPATTAAFVLVAGKRIDVNVQALTLDKVVGELVAASQKAYGAHIRIAAKLNDLMPEFAWFDIDAGEVSDNAKAMQPHKDIVYKGLHASSPEGKHSNPSVIWARLRDYGRNLRAGLAPNGKSMADGTALPAGAGEGEATGEGANPAKRSIKLRYVEELIALYKAGQKEAEAKTIPADVATAHGLIVNALKALGVDVRTIKVK